MSKRKLRELLKAQQSGLLRKYDITPSEMIMLYDLSIHASEEDDTCSPAFKVLAERNCTSKKTALRATSSLCKKGLITITHRKTRDGGNVSNSYYVNLLGQPPAPTFKRYTDNPIVKPYPGADDVNSYISLNLMPGIEWLKEFQKYGRDYEILYNDPLTNDSRIAQWIKDLKYSDFLCTPYWTALARHIRYLSGYKCMLCGSKEHLSVHHKSYEHHGYEYAHQEDLICLCQNCHAKHHNIGELNEQP